MVVKVVSNLAEEAKVRFGWLILFVAAICLVGSVSFFFSEDLVIAGIDMAGDEDTFGWYFMALSFVFAFSGLFLALSLGGDD